MKLGSKWTSLVLASAWLTFALPSASHALTMQECSARYEAVKTAGTLGDRKWNDFRKAECAANTPPAVTAAPAAATPTAPKVAEATPPKAAEGTPAPKEAAKPAATSAAAPAVVSATAVFPAVIAAKYASETPGKGRMHTCVDQYKVNKTSNGNGGMKWIEKGGGYYSQCNAKLKS